MTLSKSIRGRLTKLDQYSFQSRKFPCTLIKRSALSNYLKIMVIVSLYLMDRAKEKWMDSVSKLEIIPLDLPDASNERKPQVRIIDLRVLISCCQSTIIFRIKII